VSQQTLVFKALRTLPAPQNEDASVVDQFYPLLTPLCPRACLDPQAPS
jgi:hypothetical protein